MPTTVGILTFMSRKELLQENLPFRIIITVSGKDILVNDQEPDVGIQTFMSRKKFMFSWVEHDFL